MSQCSREPPGRLTALFPPPPPRSLHLAAMMPDLPFLPFCTLLGGLGLGCVAFVGAWCQHWRGGFAWDGSARMFNWHPVLMVTGMVVLYGAGEQRVRGGAASLCPSLTLSPTSGSGVPPTPCLAWPQAALEDAAQHAGTDSLHPCCAGTGGCL